jgi:NAD(P)-dependent dehydrogenase (short-subunit alcohol dehydrogenase family)
MRFAAKICVVTGGGSGLGRATRNRLADEGARMVVLDVDEEAAKATVEGVTGPGGQAFFVRVDVAESEEGAVGGRRRCEALAAVRRVG